MKIGVYEIGNYLGIIKVSYIDGKVVYHTNYNIEEDFMYDVNYFRYSCRDKNIDNFSVFRGIEEITSELEPFEMGGIVYPHRYYMSDIKGSYSYKVRMPVYLSAEFGDEVWFYSIHSRYWQFKNLDGDWFKIKGHPRNYADFEIIGSLGLAYSIDSSYPWFDKYGNGFANANMSCIKNLF